ncbi:uncharacterized protein ARMOST_15551 [Armillaria ostoyae]|uniref:Uncharacterized protein n=1 Tax=Armillaria ostoyae TaxID=47428 RepID=A0A284RTR8_ARMOS|nr:uncharacterized protein ARMOST_15551 [Armillaria ostoyae]
MRDIDRVTVGRSPTQSFQATVTPNLAPLLADPWKTTTPSPTAGLMDPFIASTMLTDPKSVGSILVPHLSTQKETLLVFRDIGPDSNVQVPSTIQFICKLQELRL